MNLIKLRVIKVVLIVFISIFLITLGACTCKNDNNNNIEDSLPTAAELGEILFRRFPMNESSVKAITPLGGVHPNGGHTFPTGHHYVNLKDPSIQTAIYSPGRIWILRINSSHNHTLGTTDYGIYFYSCREVKVIIGHIVSLAPLILDAFNNGTVLSSETFTTGGTTYTFAQKSVFLEVDVNTVIGYATGIDLGVYDKRITHNFVNPDRFRDSDYKHAVSCINYFTPDVQHYIKSISGHHSGTPLRTTPPIGGTVDHDIYGTVQGLWFLPGASTYPEDVHIAFVPDSIDPDIPIFSIGNPNFGIPTGCYTYDLQSSGLINRDFSDVKYDGNIYAFNCYYMGYPIVNKIILIKMLSNTEMQIEAQEFNETGPWGFKGNEMIFNR